MDIRKRNIDYFEHYAKHTHYVTLAWKAISTELWNRGFLNEEEFEKTNRLVIWHDQSKIDTNEWEPYAEKFHGEHKSDPDVKAAFKEAVKVHKAKNLHHYESLKDYKGDDWRCYIIELVCDYIAMGWEFDNYVLEYYEAHREETDLPEEYKDYLESILDVLREPQISEIVEKPLTHEMETELDFRDIILEPKKTYALRDPKSIKKDEIKD